MEAVRPDTDPAVPLLVEVMSARQRVIFRILAAVWAMTQLAFWSWWFNPANIVGPVEFLITTLLIAYFILIPGYFLLLVSQMKRPNPRLPLPMNLRVAMATSFVPGSESLEVLERTLRAMRSQVSIAADVWVLDEGDVPEVRDLAGELGVFYFTRKHMPQYQQVDWPFKAKYKAGNYNAWLDAIGYGRYDVLVQLDTDHVPSPTYLQEVLRPFSYPGVSYVAAPSDVTGNRKQSWLVMARGILDAPLHGPMQMGFNHRLCPIIIGSHSAVRVDALQEIGGFQQTRAEDHHNTVRLARFGFRGVYAPDALAVGDGPTSLADALSQEFQWARSITVVLIRFFRRDTYGLPFWRWLEFLFCETWYTLYAGTFALGILIPLVALVTNRPWARVGYLDFVIHYELIDLALVILLIWIRSQGWLRPREIPIVSWQSMLLVLGRWPVMLWAVVDAVIATAFHRDFSFGVTFKGNGPGRPLAWRTIMPQYLLVGISLGAVEWYLLVFHGPPIAEGYILLALINAILYACYIVAVTILHRQDSRRADATAAVPGIPLKLAAGVVTLALTLTVAASTLPRIGSSSLDALLPRASVSGPVLTNNTVQTTIPVRPAIIPAPTQPFLGAYDPRDLLKGVPGVQVDQYFINWTQDPDVQIVADVRQSQARGRFPMISIEPWASGKENKAPVLADITTGKYAAQERQIANALQAVAPQHVDIRFMHEMDLAGPYPWQTTDTTTYVKAFRQFVTALRGQGVTNAEYIWSPAFLNPNGLRYYPGGDVVDFVGLSTFYFSPSQFTLQQGLADPLVVARSLGRPLIVAEFGISATGLSIPQQLTVIAQLHALTAQHPAYLAGIMSYDAVLAPVWDPQGGQSFTMPAEVARTFFAAS